MDYREQRSTLPGGEGAVAQGYPQPRQSAQQTPLTTSPINHQLAQAHLRTGPLDLGFLPAASTSQTSLLEAVVGPSPPSNRANPPHAPPSAFAPRLPASAAPPAYKPHSGGSAPTPMSAAGSRDTSVGSGSYGTSTEREWEIVSDVSVDDARPSPEAVAELEKKVNKRRSNLPQLESELAALEAQIKAAEERIARAQSVGVQSASAQRST